MSGDRVAGEFEVRRKCQREWLSALVIVVGCCAGGWSDPSGDQFGLGLAPELDLIGASTRLGNDGLVISLEFEAATNPADLFELSGWVDFDMDRSIATGRQSHATEAGLTPAPTMGVDYYVEFASYSPYASLHHAGDVETTMVGAYEISYDGTVVSIALPLCQDSPHDGICVDREFDMVVLVGNLYGLTDCAPNGGEKFTRVARPGDIDLSGEVDDGDAALFAQCMTGPNIPIESTPCRFADMDEDGDADMDDWGLIQRHLWR